MLLPGHLMDESDLLLCFWVGTTEAIKYVRLFLGIKVVDSLFVEFIKDFWACGLIDITPVNILRTFTSLIKYDPFVRW